MHREKCAGEESLNAVTLRLESPTRAEPLTAQASIGMISSPVSFVQGRSSGRPGTDGAMRVQLRDKPSRAKAKPWKLLNMLLSGGALLLFLAGCRTTPPAATAFISPMERPHSALIVRLYPMERVAWQIQDPDMLGRLESFFPGYRQLAESDHSGGWLARYMVYVNFNRGRSIRLLSDGRSWSTGQSDWPVEGNFEEFAEELINRHPQFP